MSKCLKISQWLKSGEYQIEIDALLTNIIRKSELAESEAETSAIFENEMLRLPSILLIINIFWICSPKRAK